MARIVHKLGTSSSTSRTPHTAGHTQGSSSTYTAIDDSADFADSTSHKVENSPAYRNAFALFSNEPNKIWLQRLMSIPNSVQDATETWTDQLGLTTNYKDKQAANYQYCIEQINALVAEYQQWKNSLPETQVQQMADAGINSAVTGQGVNGSSIPSIGVSSNPSSVQSAQPFEIIRDAASFILDTSTGLASLALQYQQLGLTTSQHQFAEDTALLDFRKFASEKGIHVPAQITWRQLIDNYGFKVHDPGSKSRYSDNVLLQFLTHHSNADVVAGLAALYPDIAAIMAVGDDNVPHVYTGIANTPVHLDAVNRSMIDLLSAQREYDAKIKKFTAESSEYNAGKAFAEKTSAEFNKIVAQYESTRAEIADSLIKTLLNSKHESDKLLLSRILWNATYNTVELEKKQNDWYDVNASLGVATDVIGTVIP